MTHLLTQGVLQLHQRYAQYEQAYARYILQTYSENLFIDANNWRQEVDEAYSLWLKMVKDDAEKEYQMGDVDASQLRDFLETIN